jgi:hypothetical protein
MKKEEFLSVASQYYEEFESLKSQPNFYDYEKCFVDLWKGWAVSIWKNS